jgi:hypothetical protein
MTTLKNIVPKLIDDTTVKAKSEAARKAAEARNAGFRALKLKAIEMFNAKSREFPSIRQGARRITKQLEQYATDEGLDWLTTDDPDNRVYEWLLDANKAGLLNPVR